MKPKQFIPKLTSCRVGSHDKLGLLGEKVVERMPKGWSFTSLLLHFLSHTLSFSLRYLFVPVGDEYYR